MASVWSCQSFGERNFFLGQSPGLVVMGDDSCLRGCWFKSRRCIAGWTFFPLICYKNCKVCLKRPKIKWKKKRFRTFFRSNNSRRPQHWPPRRIDDVAPWRRQHQKFDANAIFKNNVFSKFRTQNLRLSRLTRFHWFRSYLEKTFILFKLILPDVFVRKY